MLPWKRQRQNNYLDRPKVVAKFHTYHMVPFKDRPPPLISERIMTEPVVNIPEVLSSELLSNDSRTGRCGSDLNKLPNGCGQA